MTAVEKLQALRAKMKERLLDAYYIPSADPHMSEYLPENYKARAFMSGFTGSAGTLIVLENSAFLWTDGRYFIQAEKQLAGSTITLCKMGEPNVPRIEDFLAEHFANGGRIGVDGKTLSVSAYKLFAEKVPALEFVTDVDLVSEIWTDKPTPIASQAYILEEKFTGESASKKIAALRKIMAEKEITATVISSLDDVCYLYTVRASDVTCNPVLTSYAIVDKDRAMLFVNQQQLSQSVRNRLITEGVTIADYNEVFTEAEKLTGTVYLDPHSTNLYLLRKIKAKVVEGQCLTIPMKAVKNKTQIENIRQAMVTDGVALVKFLYWLSNNVTKDITEMTVVQKLHELRALGDQYIGDSFETIAGYADNGAIVHYAPTSETAKKLKPKSFLLLDSGGHYYTGTTDITRTIPLGSLTEDECTDYTLVLKSHIQLALARFKAGTTGFALDTLARVPLWTHGKDFNHGTGHGVGFVLSVHEGPQSISQRYINEPLKEGMVTSNEPGIYIQGHYGIRIENLVLTKKFLETSFGEFYNFETLTLCPISTKPVRKKLLSDTEIAWLNDYNKRCYEKLSPHLTAEEKSFLSEECKGI